MAANVSPTDWFLLSDPSLSNKTSYWPWKHLTEPEWRKLLSDITSFPFLTFVVQFCYWVATVGIVTSLLTILTICLKPKHQLNSVYWAMIAISCLDAIFCMLRFIRWMISYFEPTPTIAFVYQIGSGIIYSCSLMADSLTLCVTLERYVALVSPVRYTNLAPPTVRRAWVIAVVVSAVASSSRMHYSFRSFFIANAQLEKNEWFNAAVYFSDTVVPFLYTGLMIGLVTGICVTLYRRHKAKKLLVSPKSQADQKQYDKSTKALSLLTVLLVMFFVNQIGYIMYSVADSMKQKRQLNYDDSYEDIDHYAKFLIGLKTAQALSGPLEMLSRSMVFFAYIGFNSSFRRDFMEATKRLFRRQH